MSESEEVGELEQVGIAERGKPPFVKLPEPLTLFAARAVRFAALAPGHQLEPYLSFLADLARIQDGIVHIIADSPLPPFRDLQVRAANGMPLLPREQFVDDPSALAAFARVLQDAEAIAMPEAARTALHNARTADDEIQRSMLAAVLSDAIPVETVAEHIFAAAALQVAAAKAAARLPEKLPRPVADGVCPCCGGPPATSAVISSGEVEGVRYVQCALCAARWNHVRVRCVSCGSTKGIAYHAIGGVADTIKAETCDECRTYVKILYQRKDPALEAVADDVASLGLDILVTEAGWRRAGVNPYLLGY